ncbi:hypothetical protein H9Y04_39105 [Streptomyces sp. TRM66268-LWL]|uniref:Uncharacterized protein n=1 Tax=Streptomyces polyasparticus TaxID=2767826 RepID=A0ABR7SST1_9ACTN|nr:hypothetical protein [Streptomyces polyasparticus]MBC9718552.1 hypothetical protein [Streptomyces polyasparticus]
MGRHVLPTADESSVRGAARAVSERHTWMKMPAEPGDIEAWLAPGWVAQAARTTPVDPGRLAW